MRRGAVVTLGLVAVVTASAVAAEPKGMHVAAADTLKWGPPPEGLPSGAEIAVVQGDPSVANEVFTVRIRMPRGYTIAPHWHPTTEVVTVLEGSLSMGHGDRIDPRTDTTVSAGGVASMASGMHHYAVAGPRGAEIQLHAIGPFQITYVDPADDPRNLRAAKVR